MAIISRDPLNLAADPNFMAFRGREFIEPPVVGDIATPDFIPPDSPGPITRFLADGVTPKFTTDHQALVPRTPIERDFNVVTKTMPNGAKVDFWGFYDPKLPPPLNDFKFPSDAIRIVEGQYFHGKIAGIKKKAHTIHWHGLEPTSQNDGVGKLSMEVGGSYTYQWVASAAGTYFYHCHRNTLLHFEMGMYGMLLIDPLNPNYPADPLLPPYPTGSPQMPYAGNPDGWGGPGYVRRFNTAVRYDKEAIWVLDDVDPLWHTFDHGHAMAGFGNTALDANGNPIGWAFTAGGGLNIFAPKYFCLTGVPHPWTTNLPSDPVHPGVAVNIPAGQTLLVRILSGAYSLNPVIISGLDAEVIAMDGRCMGQLPHNRYSRPFTIPAGKSFVLTAARRFDLLIKPTALQVGPHLVTMQFRHHMTGALMGRAQTFINVV